MFRGNNIFTAEKIDAYSSGSSYYQHITDLDNGDDSTNNFIQLDILMEKKNTTTNNVTKGKISAQVKELTQESFDAFIYSAVTNAIIGIIFILLFSYFRTKYKHVYYPRFTHCYSGKQIKLIQPSTSFFGWFGNILSISDEEIFTHVGLDILALVCYLYINTHAHTKQLDTIINFLTLTYSDIYIYIHNIVIILIN